MSIIKLTDNIWIKKDIESGTLEMLSLRKPDCETKGSEIVEQSEKKLLLWKYECEPDRDFNFSKKIDLANGKTIKIYTLTWVHGSHIADRCFNYIAFCDGKYVGYGESDPWSNVDGDYYNFEQRVLERCSVV
jgi:hypothetical protein